MKTLVVWLSDPCVHILLVTLALIRLAMIGAADDASVPDSEQVPTVSCPRTQPVPETCPSLTAGMLESR